MCDLKTGIVVFIILYNFPTLPPPRGVGLHYNNELPWRL